MQIRPSDRLPTTISREPYTACIAVHRLTTGLKAESSLCWQQWRRWFHLEGIEDTADQTVEPYSSREIH